MLPPGVREEVYLRLVPDRLLATLCPGPTRAPVRFRPPPRAHRGARRGVVGARGAAGGARRSGSGAPHGRGHVGVRGAGAVPGADQRPAVSALCHRPRRGRSRHLARHRPPQRDRGAAGHGRRPRPRPGATRACACWGPCWRPWTTSAASWDRSSTSWSRSSTTRPSSTSGAGAGTSWGASAWRPSIAGFQPGGDLHRRLDDSSPFRRRGLERTARGRSWAIHDGVLDGPWEGVKMFRAPDAPAGISTFPDGPY